MEHLFQKREGGGRGYLAAVKRYARLLYVFARFSLMSQLEYRLNFAAGVAVETGWMLIKLLYVAVVYRGGSEHWGADAGPYSAVHRYLRIDDRILYAVLR